MKVTSLGPSTGVPQGSGEFLLELLNQYSGWILTLAEVRRTEDRYWIYVSPLHAEFWETFGRCFDPEFKLAKKLGARTRDFSKTGGPFCPEFLSISGLFDWLYECTGNPGFLWVPLL